MKRPIVVLAEPPEGPVGGPTQRSTREFYAVDAFAAAMSAAAGVQIPVIEKPLAEAPRDALIVGYFGADVEWALRAVPPEAQADLCHRLVMMNGGRTDWFQMVERWDLAGAVEYTFYLSNWRHPQGGGRKANWGVIGRKDVGASLGMTLLSGPLYETPRYAWLEDERRADLPELLWVYLEGYDKMVLG